MTLLQTVFPAGFPPSRTEPVRGSVPGIQSLLSWDDLERIVETSCFEGAGSAAIRRHLGLPEPVGSRVCVLTNGESIWRVPRRPDPEDLRRRLVGATLRVEALEDVHPPLAELARAMNLPGRTVYINAYAAWSDTKGLALHYDYTDNLALQLDGRKYWRIYRPTRDQVVPGPESSAYKEGLQAAARGEAGGDFEELERVRAGLFWEGELVAGDALYLPPGWFHEVVPLGVPTLHIACAFGAPGEPHEPTLGLRLPSGLRTPEPA